VLANTLLPVDEFIQRREHFLAQMPENSVAIFAAAKEVTRSNDTEYTFCQNKNFYYLTGFEEPDAVLFLIKTDECKSVLFCREKNPLQEVWHGRRVGAQQAKEYYAFDQAYSLNELDDLAIAYLSNKEQIWFCHALSTSSSEKSLSEKITHWQKAIATQSRQGIRTVKTLFDCRDVIAQMRLIKSTAELDVMKQVNVISGDAHSRAMKTSAVGLFEYQIEAELIHEFARKGARHPAYGTIVAGGDNANILHYTNNDDVLKNNELLLIDAGGELAHYAADITRTFPINGKFTDAQKVLYQLVLDAQNIAISAIKPQANFAQLNSLVIDFLTQGLFELDILSGDITELLEAKASKKYFIHGLGHWLGLDVHDVGDYQSNEQREQLRAFEAGMVMTIEPGLYIPLDDESVDEKWRGIGIRIEDNIAVTKQGHENFTITVPKTIDEIEALMAKNSLN